MPFFSSRQLAFKGSGIHNGHHNHEASTAHPSLRRLNHEQKEEEALLSRVRAAPRTTIAAARQNNGSEHPITVKDVYNARIQIRTEALGGRTSIQALIEELEEENFIWKVETDTGNHVTHLLFAARKAVALFEAYPEVLLLDCTYQTNKFKMPLLNGLTGLDNPRSTWPLHF